MLCPNGIVHVDTLPADAGPVMEALGVVARMAVRYCSHRVRNFERDQFPA